MVQRRWTVLAAAVAVATASCGSDPVAGGDDGTVRPDVPADGTDLPGQDDGGDPGVRPDAAPDPAGGDTDDGEPGDPGCTDCDVIPADPGDVAPPCPGSYGCPCASNDDCFSDFCIESVAGRICTKTCVNEDSCPAAWSCSQTTVGGETIYLCIDPLSTLCRPCQENRDCVPTVGGSTGRFGCLAFGPEGSFCGTGCTTGADCPEGYDCADVATGGTTARWCVPADGAACPCTDFMKDEGFTTACQVVVDGLGACAGSRTCDEACDAPTPVEEACNAIDDDCDGATDEGTAGDPCELTNAFGTCPGTTACRSGEPLCEGTAPKAETCNGADDDCDDAIDEMDAGGCVTYYLDTDGDQYGLSDDTRCLCSAKDKYTATAGGDCDDTNAQVRPGAPEVCNGRDDNCQDGIDEDGALNCLRFYKDEDGDGAGLAGSDRCLCAAAAPWTSSRGDDCNDGNNTVSPTLAESCNGQDDDCDGGTDEAGAANCTTFYLDTDRDTWGWAPSTQCLCAAAAPYDVVRSGDCNDNDPLVSGSGTESCNGVDDDCDGQTDEAGAAACVPWYKDNDGDGWGVGTDSLCLCASAGKYTADVDHLGDCNDGDGGVNPAAAEVCNGKDDDCDTAIDEDGANGCNTLFLDVDGDTWGAIGSSRCLCASNPVPGYTATRGQDCNDLDGAIKPDAVEACTVTGDPKDEDCDGTADEAGAGGCTNYYRDQDHDGQGSDASVQCLCVASAEYSVTNAKDCCDTDDRVKVGQTTPYSSIGACGNYDFNCDGNPVPQDQSTGGGCTSWTPINTGCEREPYWVGGTFPACGQFADKVTGGCGYTDFPFLDCKSPTTTRLPQYCL